MIRHWRRRGDEAVSRIAFDLPEYAGTQVGRVTHVEWAAAIERRLDRPDAADLVARWLSYRGDVDAEMVALVAAVRREVPVALVSNATDRLREDLACHGLRDAFDVVVCSAEVGLVKPDREIFDHATAAVGVPPGECFFTDDLEPNVAGAVAAGLRAVRFTDRDALVGELRALGLLRRTGG